MKFFLNFPHRKPKKKNWPTTILLPQYLPQYFFCIGTLYFPFLFEFETKKKENSHLYSVQIMARLYARYFSSQCLKFHFQFLCKVSKAFKSCKKMRNMRAYLNIKKGFQQKQKRKAKVNKQKTFTVVHFPLKFSWWNFCFL